MNKQILYTEKLFSYGTLQQEAVQLAIFSRKLTGTSAILTGYCLSHLQINDPKLSLRVVQPPILFCSIPAQQLIE